MIDSFVRRQGEQEKAQSSADAGRVLQRYWGEYVHLLANLPGTRAVWGMGSIDELGNAYDASGQARTLTKNGGVTFGVYNHVVPYANYNGSTGYHARADENGLDLLGNEAVIEPALQGLTLIAWYWKDTTPASQFVLACKGDLAAVGNDNFLLTLSPNPSFTAYNGASAAAVNGGAASNGAWHCAIARFKPGVEVSLDNDGAKVAAATALTGLTNSTQSLLVGAALNSGAPALFFDGRLALLSLAGAWIDDDLARFLYR